MKILLLNQFFWPDAAPTGELLADLARELAHGGWEVTVLCGSSAYAGERDKLPEILEIPGVLVRRASVPAFGRGIIPRMLSYGSYLAVAAGHCLFRSRPDVVVTMTTPPFLSVAGALAQRLRGVRHVIWEMDMYPDVAVDLGVIQQRAWVTRILGALGNYVRRTADAVIVLGNCMRERMLDQRIPLEKIHVAENWADGDAIFPRPRPPHDGILRVLYSGNLGRAHDIDTICSVMEQLGNDPRIQFTFAGGGSRRAKLEAFCRDRGLQNVEFRSYCKRSLLGQELSKADIGLVTQKPECLGSVVPSKVYGLMAAGRPYLFIGPLDSTPGEIIEKHNCGWRADCGDVPSLVSLLQRLSEQPGLVARAGERARHAFLHDYNKPQGTARIVAVINAVTPGAQVPAVKVHGGSA